MKIEESIIESCVNQIENDEHFFQESITQLRKTQQDFFNHLQSESFLLSPEENDHLLGLLFVLFWTTKGVEKKIRGNKWSQIEDAWWAQLEAVKGLSEFMDLAFKELKEEDLLAFVEDSLAELEDDFLTRSGREFIAVKCVSLIQYFENYHLS